MKLFRLGALASLILLAAMAASFRWLLEYGSGPSWWTLEEGRFRVGWFFAGDPRIQTKTQGWSVQAAAGDPGWRQQIPSWRFSGPPFAYINLPLWPGLVTLGVGTWFLWARGRRRGAYMCPKCGYDLTGVPRDGSTVCPECGSRTNGRQYRPQDRMTRC
jgi:hypothetical protein